MAFTNRYSSCIRRFSTLYLSCLVLILCGCASGIRVQGSHYVHRLYQHAANSDVDQNIIVIYVEGDGLPWVDHGTRPAVDPTPIHALGYHLYKATPYAAWYLTRPCYNHVKDAACNPLIWTHARYSEQVVDSMAAVINNSVTSVPDISQKKIFLVGYSGGGTLTLLLAPRLSRIAGVITIAGNLDINAWTQLHGYEVLSASLNPVEMKALPVRHIALVGDKDTNIPFSILNRYLSQHPDTIVEHFANYDHVCCWEKNWPALLNTTLAKMNQ